MDMDEQMSLDNGQLEGSGGANATGAADPFDSENIGVVHFIQLARIYDVLMAMYAQTHPEGSDEMSAAHARGDLLGTSPRFSGRFISDESV